MKIRNYYRDLGKSTAILSVKQGLTLVIPFLILGSFALLFKSFPYPPYQEFITAFLGGRILNILDAVYTITLGSLALLLTVTISLSFGRMSESNEAFYYAVTALVSYMAFCGGIMENEEYIFGPEWVFTAMCITMLSCALFRLSVRAARKFEGDAYGGSRVFVQLIHPEPAADCYNYPFVRWSRRTAEGVDGSKQYYKFRFVFVYEGISSFVREPVRGPAVCFLFSCFSGFLESMGRILWMQWQRDCLNLEYLSIRR